MYQWTVPGADAPSDVNKIRQHRADLPLYGGRLPIGSNPCCGALGLPGWWNADTASLNLAAPRGRAGSSPAPGTSTLSPDRLPGPPVRRSGSGRLGSLLDVPTAAVSGHVIGEHGDSAVVCASTTTVYGHPAAVPLRWVRDELIVRPGRISAGIGRTRCGPAGAVVSALRLALGLQDGTCELSVPHRDVWLGIPVRFIRGLPLPSVPPLDSAEAGQLEAARAKLRAAYQAVRIPSQPLQPRRNSSWTPTPYAWRAPALP